MPRKEVVMLLDNAFAPDMRVQKEALCLKDLGCNITIFAWDRQFSYKRDDEQDGIRIKRIRTNAGFQKGIKQLIYLLIFYIKAFLRLCNTKLDIIYCHDLLMLPIGILVKTLWRKKLVYDAHEIYWIMEEKKYSRFILKSIRLLENMMIRSVDSLITVSEQRAGYYKSFYPKTIYTVGNYYNPVPVGLEQKKALRRKLGLPEEKTVISYIGGLHAERDFHLLTEYAASHKDVFVIIAGLGYWQDMIRSAAEKTENLRYLGWVSNPIEYYCASDIIYYLLNEDYAYNHFNAPNNIYLSIALKVPIIANPIGDTGRIMKEYDIGAALESRSLPDMEQAVSDVLKNRLDMIPRFEEAQKEYNWDNAKSRLKEAIGS